MRVEHRGPWLWEIPPDARPGMRVPGRIYADEGLFEAIRRDGSLEQVANAATLPGIAREAVTIPGSVAALATCSREPSRRIASKRPSSA